VTNGARTGDHAKISISAMVGLYNSFFAYTMPFVWNTSLWTVDCST